MRIRTSLIAVALVVLSIRAQAQLYRSTFIQAAPGRLLELIDVIQARQPVYDVAMEARPYMLRHSQGDKWDILLLEPLGPTMDAYYSPARSGRRFGAALGSGTSDVEYTQKLRELTAWREDQIVKGPAPERVAEAFRDNGFAHLEMFVALAGRYEDLLKERAMENAYYYSTIEDEKTRRRGTTRLVVSSSRLLVFSGHSLH